MNRNDFNSSELFDDDDQPQAPSKSQLKREMHELQDLGAAIVTLSKDRIKSLNLPEKLTDALKQWQGINAHGGKKRQLQYIGRLMREVDPEPIRQALDGQHRGSAKETLRLHHLETLRNNLINAGELGQATLTQWVAEHPSANIQQLRQLIRAAQKDASNNPEVRSGKSFRELFQYLKENDLPQSIE